MWKYPHHEKCPGMQAFVRYSQYLLYPVSDKNQNLYVFLPQHGSIVERNRRVVSQPNLLHNILCFPKLLVLWGFWWLIVRAVFSPKNEGNKSQLITNYFPLRRQGCRAWEASWQVLGKHMVLRNWKLKTACSLSFYFIHCESFVLKERVLCFFRLNGTIE